MRKLTKILKKHSGRNAQGKVTVRHQGGRHKRFLRRIDFKRQKHGIIARVVSIDYDPNRTSKIALLSYEDGEKRYIIAPKDLETGTTVVSGEDADIKVGNALPLAKIPVGMFIHNVEITPGKGGQIARGAGGGVIIQAKEGKHATLKLPSGVLRKVPLECYATIGQVGNVEKKMIKIGKAGRKIHMGIRPSVRGIAQNPHSHPHGGGEGRSGIGMPSTKSPWGKRVAGKRTRRKHRYSNLLIVKRIN